MEIRKIVEREFTEEEKSTIENVGKYVWGTIAIIGKNSGILFEEADNMSFSDDELIKKAAEYMDDIFCCQPDFVSYDMDDGACLVFMDPGFSFSAPDMPNSIGIKLAIREQLRDACERGEVIAIIEVENKED